MKTAFLLMAGVVFGLAPTACRDASPADHWIVTVTGGEVRGVVEDGVASFKGIPVTLIILAALVLIYGIIQNRSVFGRHIYAIGGNRHAAELSGIKTRQVDF